MIIISVSNQWKKLYIAAAAARDKAYAPYSNFQVGAALQTNTGQIITGVNVENAAFGLCMCAERNALFHALAAGEKRKTFLALGIIADASNPVTPCGSCRQVMSELCPPQMPVVMWNTKGQELIRTVEDLLPDSFTMKENTDDGSK